MAKLLKLRRGTNTQHSTFTGAEGEVTVNTTNDSLHVHDGTTAGGTELAKADLSNAAGASIPGTLTTNRLVVDDDGSASPNAVFKTDDQGPWAVAIKNDTYSTTETHGLLVHQESAGDVYIRNGGNGAWENTWIQHHNGTDTRNMVRLDADGSVDLYYQNAKKLETKSDGIDVTGEVQCDSLDVDGSGDFTGDVSFRGEAGAVTIVGHGDIRLENGNWTGDYAGKIQHHSNFLYLQGGTGGIIFRSSGTDNRAQIDSNGHFIPGTDDAYDLGSSTSQWRNAYIDGTVFTDGLEVTATANLSSKVYSTERTATASSFDLATGNFWTFGAIAVPNPTNQTAGMSGLLRVTAAPTSFASNWDFPGGSYTAPTSFPAVAPFFVQASGTILVGNWTEGIT